MLRTIRFTLLLTGSLLALTAAPALALEGHALSSSFGLGGVGAGEFKNIQGLAVDQSSGDVYVYDNTGSGTVYRFSATGEPLDFSGLASNAITGVGIAGLDEQELAIDSSPGPDRGDLYVANGSEVEIYSDTTGQRLGALTGGEMCGVAVDPTGAVYVGIYGSTVKRYVPKANPVTSSDYTSSLVGVQQVCNVAVDGEGNIYVNSYNGAVRKYAAAQLTTGEATAVTMPPEAVFDESGSTLAVDTSTNAVLIDEVADLAQFDSTGAPVSHFGELGAGAVKGSYGVAVNSTTGDSASGDVYAASGTGQVDIFTPAPLPPAGNSGAVSDVENGSATLDGDIEDPSSVSGGVGYYFVYREGASCVGPGKVATPLDNGGANALGSGDVQVQTSVVGLNADTQYSACLATSGAGGTVFGHAVQFTSASVRPVVASEGSRAVGQHAATLEAVIDPEREEASCELQYVTRAEFESSGYASATSIPCEPASLEAGPYEIYVSARPHGLQGDTSYRFRVSATNGTGTTTSAGSTFTTLALAAPALEDESVATVGEQTAQLEASIDPHEEATTCEVHYVTQTAFEASGYATASSAPCEPANVGEGGEGAPVSATLPGLAPATIYHYQLLASNGAGTTTGPDRTLTTLPAKPAASTGAATADPSAAGVTVTGMVDPHGNGIWQTTYEIEYGLTTVYGSQVQGNAGMGDGTVAVSGVLAELPAGTYHYRVAAKNAGGESFGADGTFTVVGGGPLVGAESAQFVNESSAVILAVLNPQGAPASYEVQYGTSTAYGSRAAPLEMAAVTSSQGTITEIAGLLPGTTYHYRLVATSSAGTADGQDATFTTTGATPTTAFTSFAIPTAPQIAVVPFTLPGEAGASTKAGTKKTTKPAKRAKSRRKKGKKPAKRAKKRSRRGKGLHARRVG
jgi:hypothetical protein